MPGSYRLPGAKQGGTTAPRLCGDGGLAFSGPQVPEELLGRAETMGRLREDIRAVFERDPAAKSWLEVLLCYPGLHALAFHRVAHALYRRRLYLAARLVSHLGRWLTGIEIHPGARIGRRVFIDHGFGVVIGETAEVGDDVIIYQGVTLGGTGKEKGKRHPTIEAGCVLGVGAKVLGAITVGRGSRVGAGAVVVKDVPPDCTVVGVPGRIVIQNGERVEPLEHGRLPDPVAEALREERAWLEARLKTLEERLARGAEVGPAESAPPGAEVEPPPPGVEAGPTPPMASAASPASGGRRQ